MKNNDMIEYKESFISKIKRFFTNIFKKSKKQEVSEFQSNISDESVVDFNKVENEFFNNIKVDPSNVDKVVDKKKFLEYIDGNVEALKMLSIDRLRKLIEYYDGVIEENDKIIEKLKKDPRFIKSKKIGIYCENTESDACKKRIDGIKDTLAESGCVVMWIVSGVSDTGEKINLQSQRKVDIVLAIDDASVVEAAKEASDNNLQGALVYGIGNSTEAIYYLDSGWTEALITPDEFAAGYKSVVGLVDMLRGSRKYSVEEKPVSYQLLTRKNLFDEENKKLLYAISQ